MLLGCVSDILSSVTANIFHTKFIKIMQLDLMCLDVGRDAENDEEFECAVKTSEKPVV